MDDETVLLCLATLATTIVALKARAIMRKRHRRFKVRPLNRDRKNCSVYNKLVKFAEENDKEQFFKYTRMSVEMFHHLLQLVEPRLKKNNRGDTICPAQRLAITLHYLSEGCSMQEIAWNNYIGKATAHCIIKDTCAVLWEILAPLVLPTPTTEDLITIAGENYKRWNFPNCIGALDGKHVQIQCPNYSGSAYFSHKKSFSMVILATCDTYYRFTYVDIGAAGANHDSVIFKNSSYGKALMEGSLEIPPPTFLPKSEIKMPHFFVADQAFPLHQNIMRPYPGSYLGSKKNIFNLRLSRVRRTIENAFGILAQRWRRLRNPIIASTEVCEHIIKACIVLHNFIQKGEKELPLSERRYCPTGFTDWVDDNGEIHDGHWRELPGRLQSVGRLASNNASRSSQELRNTLAEYFISQVGAIPNQWQQIYEGSVPPQFATHYRR